MNKVRAAAVLLCLLASSCIPLRRNLVMTIPGEPQKPVRFAGIEQSLNPARVSKLLIIHGMGNHDFQYADRLIELLSAQLKLDPFACQANKVPIKDAAGAPPYAEMTICDYRRTSDQSVLRIYTLLWSPLTRHLKERNLDYDWKNYGSGRRWVNRKIKDAIIDNSVSDAVLFAGQFAPRMRYAVEQAICAMIKDHDLLIPCTLQDYSAGAEAGQSDVFIVTHSLGSMMLFESLASLGRSSPEAIKVLGSHIKLVAMLANQLPLLQLARYRIVQSTVTLTDNQPEATLDLQFDSLFMLREPKEPLTIVAFNDRNDLLSYPMPDDWPKLFPNFAGRVTFVNGFNANAPYAILGIVADPSAAHSGYWHNPRILRVLAKGYPVTN